MFSVLSAPGAESGQTFYFYSIAHFPGQINTAPGGNAEINLYSLLAPAPSQALPRQLPQRGSQGLRLIAKVLGYNEKVSGSALASPFGRGGFAKQRRRGRTRLQKTALSPVKFL